jgi:dephospho-CoA kinase
MPAILRIALTGGIGSGKSTVTSIFEQLGVPVIDSDIISRDIVKPGSICLNKIIQEFSKNILTDNGTLDRKKLRSIVFNNNEKRRKLENILHPAIFEEIDNQVNKVDFPYCLIVIPLLTETNMMDNFDRVLVIDVPENVQLQRASQRDNTSIENIEKILKSQSSRQQRLQFADDVIDNNLTLDKLRDEVSDLHKKFIALSSSHN